MVKQSPLALFFFNFPVPQLEGGGGGACHNLILEALDKGNFVCFLFISRRCLALLIIKSFLVKLIICGDFANCLKLISPIDNSMCLTVCSCHVMYTF